MDGDDSNRCRSCDTACFAHISCKRVGWGGGRRERSHAQCTQMWARGEKTESKMPSTGPAPTPCPPPPAPRPMIVKAGA